MCATMARRSAFLALIDWFRGPAPVEAPVAPPPTPLPAKVDFDFSDPRLPDNVGPLIAQVTGLIEDIEHRAANEPQWSPHIAEIRQLRDYHLPTMLKSYVEIPAAHRAEIFRRTGHSASYALAAALDKMIERLRQMSASLAQGNIDAFTANLHFIDLRYGAAPLSSD